MLCAKFQDHRTGLCRRFLKFFSIYGHGDHLGHETKFMSPAPNKDWL